MLKVESIPQHKISILIADDHKAFREGLSRLLCDEPDLEVVKEARNGQETVQLACELAPDVVIIDIAMPGLNGIDAIKRIRNHNPRTQFLVLSAFSYDAYVLAAIEAGASAYVLKTEGVREIADAVRSVHSGRMVFSSEVNSTVRKRFDYKDAPSVRPRIQLSPRERELLVLAARGLGNKEIAAKANIAERTVQTRFHDVLARTGAASRTQAVVLALSEGWITFDDVRLDQETPP